MGGLQGSQRRLYGTQRDQADGALGLPGRHLKENPVSPTREGPAGAHFFHLGIKTLTDGANSPSTQLKSGPVNFAAFIARRWAVN